MIITGHELFGSFIVMHKLNTETGEVYVKAWNIDDLPLLDGDDTLSHNDNPLGRRHQGDFSKGALR